MGQQQTSDSKSVTQSRMLFRSLVGKSAPMQRVRQEIDQVAKSDANVLIQGESGTGKEVVARNVHYNSSRRNHPFVPVNCGAILADLLESELFGHEKGAFTGAITARNGRFAMAEGGTLFLDEIGEMTMAMQVKLLRVLEERVFERVGGTTTIQADVRIIAATNRNLEEMVAAGKFREDLYFRLDVFPINLPTLKDRKEDIPLLVNELITRLEHNNRGSVRFTSDAITAMARYDWPGNVRELGNQIERMAIKFPGGLVRARDLPEKFRDLDAGDVPELDLDEIEMKMQGDHSIQLAVTNNGSVPALHLPTEGFDLKTYISNIEINIIQEALNKSDGVIAHAAKTLGLRRTTLAEKMRKYNIEREPGVAA